MTVDGKHSSNATSIDSAYDPLSSPGRMNTAVIAIASMKKPATTATGSGLNSKPIR